MLEKLTPEQEAAIPGHRDEWISVGRCSEPADRPEAEAGVVDAYVAAGLEPPEETIWADSPLAGAILAGAIVDASKLIDRSLDDIRSHVRERLAASAASGSQP